MRLSYNWLKSYVDLSGITPKELATAITACGLEVEGIEVMASGTNLVIGYVESCIEHPDSDHLHLCQVNTGNDSRQIVCGAPNVASGQKVIVALPGCILPGGEIKEGVIRNQESKGMICSLAELGVDKRQLTEEQLAGIEVLPADAEVGNVNVLEYLSLDDSILEVSLTPNRNDCLAMWSMAKEVGAILNREVKLPDYQVEIDESSTALRIDTETEKCSVFIGKIINNVTIKESPKWIKDALQGAGVKSINNVVDISNLVMLETGQPLHYYDLAKIPAKQISAVQGCSEPYTALDGIEYKIIPDDIMISTNGHIIGIAGIMGGDDSKIDENTTGIIIEAAIFDAVSVRGTARRLNLPTEAATHFIKGVEPLAGVKAVQRSVQLLVEYANASGIEETIVAGKINDNEVKITVTLAKINRVLGTNFTLEEVVEPLVRLDLNPETTDGEITVTVPSYRPDLKIAEDIIEEIIRIRGFDNISSSLPVMETTVGSLPKNGRTRRSIKSALTGNGLSEIITYSLVSKKHIDESTLPINGVVEIANPISDERRYYRTSLIPSMLETASFNHARSQTSWGMFEIGSVYDGNRQGYEHLAIAISDNINHSSWQKINTTGDFYLLKGLIIDLLAKLGFSESRITIKQNSTDIKNFHPKHSAEIYLGLKLIGVFGEVHPAVRIAKDIDKCVIAELNLDELYSAKPAKVKYVPVCKFPAVTHDIAILVDSSTQAHDIISIVRKQGGKLLVEAEVFDVYQGKGIADGKKSIAVSLVYQSNERTLSENDITPIQNKILEYLEKELNAKLR